MTAQLSPSPVFKAFSNDGFPLAYGKLTTYAAGTTTKIASYTDSTQTTQNTNPITLNARGECALWLDPSRAYKISLTDSFGNPIPGYPVDNINAPIGPTSILTFGADPTGNADSTAAMIAAHATGSLIYYPRGTYKCSSGITIPGGGIVGDGAYLTFIETTDTGSSDIFNYTGAFAGRFENFSLQPATTKSGGYGFVVGPASGEVSGMRFFQCVFNALPNCINFVAASLWSIDSCNFYGYTGNGINIQNTNNADSGDSSIVGCILTSPGNNSANSIRQVASGGLRIIGCKLNNAGVGYLLDLGSGSTSDLMITGCSFENAHFSAIQLQRTAGAATFGNVSITGCQFLVASGTGNSTGIFTNNGAAFLTDISITGNTFHMTDTGTASCITVDYVNDFLIDANTMLGGGGATNFGIVIGTHNTNPKVGVNQIRNFGNSINAPAGTNIIASDFQTGTTNVTTSSVFGSLFSGTVTITFSTAFCTDFPPTLQNCSATVTSTTGGGICAQVVSVSSTQLVIDVIGITNGGSVPIQWCAGGVI